MKWIHWLVDFCRDHPRVAGVVLVVVVGGGAALAGLALGTWRNICYDCPSIAQLYVWEPEQTTRIFSADGQVIAELSTEKRTPVAIETLPDYIPQAFIAIEDKRFYSHSGFDVIGFTRAMVDNIIHMEIVAGGSTITQQLARNMFDVRIGFDQLLTRKLKELKVAFAIEEVYSKEQILEAYINQINYSCRAWYGIETAAQQYFGKHAAQLNPAEAAMLAAVINSPCNYSPLRNPDLALSRRNLVLGMMASQGIITQAAADRWRNYPVPTEAHAENASQIAPYFVADVREILDDRYGSGLYSEGLRIYTTLNVEMQRRARAAMEAGWRTIESHPEYDHPIYSEVMEAGGTDSVFVPYVQGMFIAMDARTGAIKAMVGGRDFTDSKFNRATQARRQPGSAFKPFVYTAAITSGVPPSRIIRDSPLILEQADGTTWSPSNFGETFHGPMTLREALRRSINVVAAKLGQVVGIQTVVQTAHRLGLDTPIPEVPSTAIGAASVIPIQMVGAYSTFANQGVRVQPYSVTRIENSEGRVLWRAEVERERVLESLPAYVIRDMLRDVVDAGTAHGAVRVRGEVPYELPAGGKTGTTNDFTNVWFMGFTPDIVASVWFGFDRPQTIVYNATGGGYAAPVWANFIRSVYYSDPPILPLPSDSVWAKPPGIVERRIDIGTGKLATEFCPPDEVYTEVFLPGTVPNEACDAHGPGLFGVPLRGFTPESAIPDTAVPDSMAEDSAAVDTLPVENAPADTTAGAGRIER